VWLLLRINYKTKDSKGTASTGICLARRPAIYSFYSNWYRIEEIERKNLRNFYYQVVQRTHAADEGRSGIFCGSLRVRHVVGSQPRFAAAQQQPLVFPSPLPSTATESESPVAVSKSLSLDHTSSHDAPRTTDETQRYDLTIVDHRDWGSYDRPKWVLNKATSAATEARKQCT
jgi:hypothetical protein